MVRPLSAMKAGPQLSSDRQGVSVRDFLLGHSLNLTAGVDAKLLGFNWVHRVRIARTSLAKVRNGTATFI